MLIAIVMAILMTGCAKSGIISMQTNEATYSCELTQIDISQAIVDRYGPLAKIGSLPDGKFSCEDSLFSGVFEVSKSRINFTLENRRDHSIKLIWDAAAFIDVDGNAGRITHSGIDYVNRNEPQPPSIIPTGTKLDDFALPTSRVSLREDYTGEDVFDPDAWQEAGLVLPDQRQIASNDSEALEQFTAEAQANQGERIGLLLPLEDEGDINEIILWFEIKSVSVQQLQ